jgi:hypothetical protein
MLAYFASQGPVATLAGRGLASGTQRENTSDTRFGVRFYLTPTPEELSR